MEDGEPWTLLGRQRALRRRHNGPGGELDGRGLSARGLRVSLENDFPKRRFWSAVATFLLIAALWASANQEPADERSTAAWRDPADPLDAVRASCTKTRPTTFVFVHLHKTAGNNLKTHLFRFAKRNELLLHHTCRPAQKEPWATALWFARQKDPAKDYDCNLMELASLNRSLRSQFDLIVGHQYYGTHRLIPNRDTQYFTILRHPLDRKASHYGHFERSRRGDGHLKNYLLRENLNYMTKRLAGTPGASATRWSEFVADVQSRVLDWSPTLGAGALRRATQHLSTAFFFAGVQERYSESLCVLSELLSTACFDRGRAEPPGRRGPAHQLLEWQAAARSHENERQKASDLDVKRRRLREDLGAETVAQFESHAELLDMELYAAALRRFETQLALFPQCKGV